MIEPWPNEFEALRSRLNGLIERSDLGDDGREVAAEALEELAVVIEELQTQNHELVASRETLDQERQHYRDLFNTVPDGYVVTDSQGMIREANATACDLFGQPRDRIVTKPLATLIEPPDQRAFYAHLNRIRQAGAGSHLTINLLVHDHAVLPANLRATVTEANAEGETDIRWLIHDRRPEIDTEEVRASEERLRALFDTAQVGILLCDADGQIVFTNQYADQTLERHPDGLEISQWLSTTHPEDRADVEAVIHSACESGEPRAIRHRVMSNDGTIRWVEHGAAPFRKASDNSIDGFVCTLTDVSAEHTAMVSLEESRDYTAAIVDTVGALIVVIDADGVIQRFNKTCERVTGFSASEVVGRSVLDTLIPSEQRDAVAQTMHSLRSGSGRNSENDWLTKDGDRRTISWTNTTIIGPDESIVAMIGTGIDITDQRFLESRIAQAERLDSIGRLAAGIAHDFNNTLTTLRLRVDRLGGRNLDSRSRVDINEAVATIERTQTVISDLLTFSRQQSLAPRPTDINAETRRIMALLADFLGNNIDLELELTNDEAISFIDPARFDQILTNLTINASDAMPDGGTLIITTKLETSDTARSETDHSLTGLDPGNYVRVTVSDTGTGIAPNDLARIFEPYFTTKPTGHGTGLGLATTYGTIGQAGGAIIVDSEPGQGTTFSLWLPTPEQDTS